MAKAASKARPSRVEIVISDRLRGGAEPELPFRMLVMGDYTLQEDTRPIETRKPVDINKSNFDAVMQDFNVALKAAVPDRISGQGDLPVTLRFGTLKDFRPESVARQVPEIKKLVDLRNALKALGPKLRPKRAEEILNQALKDPGVCSQILAMITGSAPSDRAPATEPTPGEPKSS